jgi:outer membrane protein
MMTSLSGLLFLSQSGVAAPEATNQLKIGLVDMQEALQSVESGKKAKAQLEKEMASKRQALENQQNAIRKETEAFQKKAAVMNETARAAKDAEIQKRIADFQKSFQETQMELQKRERELTNPIIESLRAILEGIGKAQGFTLVLEKNAGGVLYAQGSTDLTKELVEAANKKKK